MTGLLRLISLMVSFAGFAMTAGALLARGEALPSAIVRAVVVFVAMWAVLTVLSALAGPAVRPETVYPKQDDHEEKDRQQ